MWNGSGDRTCKIFVKFDHEFRNVPTINHSLNGLDASGSSNRVNVWIQDITQSGFSIGIFTWNDTKLYGVFVDWIAFGK